MPVCLYYSPVQQCSSVSTSSMVRTHPLQSSILAPGKAKLMAEKAPLGRMGVDGASKFANDTCWRKRTNALVPSQIKQILPSTNIIWLSE